MPVVDTTQSFATGDTVTSTTLNNIMDQSIFVAGAVVSGSGLAVTAGGQMTISNMPGSSITDNTLSGTKITNNTVTVGKLASPSFSWASASNSGGFEVGTNITTNGPSYVDFHSVFPLTDYEARVIRNSGADGTLDLVNNGTGAIRFSASGGVTIGTANMPNPTGSAPLFSARAWVSFDATVSANLSGTVARSAGSTKARITITNHGLLTNHKVFINFASAITDGSFEVEKVDDNNFDITTGASTLISGVAATISKLTIRSSGNVSSVSRVSAGNFIVNFTNPMQSSNNYTGLFSSFRFAYYDRSQSSNAYASVQTDNGSGSATDYAINNFVVFE